MQKPQLEVRRRRVTESPEGYSVLKNRVTVEDVSSPESLLARVKDEPDLFEIRPGEIFEIFVDEPLLSATCLAECLKITDEGGPSTKLFDFDDEILYEVFGVEAWSLGLTEDFWADLPGHLMRRSVFINQRPFLAVRDLHTNQTHLVEIDQWDEPGTHLTPIFPCLIGVGFTEWDSMTSGYQGEDLGLLSEDLLIRYWRYADEQSNFTVERMEPVQLVETIVEYILSQFPEFLTLVLIEALIGHLPAGASGEVPEAWVKDGGSLTATASYEVSPILTSRDSESDLRKAVIAKLLERATGGSAEDVVAKYIVSITNSDSPTYQQRIKRHSLVELEL